MTRAAANGARLGFSVFMSATSQALQSSHLRRPGRGAQRRRRLQRPLRGAAPAAERGAARAARGVRRARERWGAGVRQHGERGGAAQARPGCGRVRGS